jgi:hypothetical protein
MNIFLVEASIKKRLSIAGGMDRGYGGISAFDVSNLIAKVIKSLNWWKS